MWLEVDGYESQPIDGPVRMGSVHPRRVRDRRDAPRARHPRPRSATIDSGAALVSALAEEFPRYLAYVFGFLFVGTYWIATHRIMGWMRGVDHLGLVLGLLYLMVISAVPFVTALLAEYIGLDNGRDQVGLVVFASWQLILSILAIATFRYAAHGGRLMKPTIDEEVLARISDLPSSVR